MENTTFEYISRKLFIQISSIKRIVKWSNHRDAEHRFQSPFKQPTLFIISERDESVEWNLLLLGKYDEIFINLINKNKEVKKENVENFVTQPNRYTFRFVTISTLDKRKNKKNETARETEQKKVNSVYLW